MSDLILKKIKDKDRRTAILSGVSLAVAAGMSGVVQANHAHEDEGEHHHDHGDMENAHKAVIDSALDCVKTGEACAAHCIKMMQDDDTSLADCLQSVSELLPMCNALASLASHDSKHLKALAKVCIDVCGDCEKECRKHEQHPACKACMQSCSDCVEQCEKLVA